MLFNCKPGCSGKKITTTAKLDLESNEVICDLCGEILNISNFTKNSMKQRGEVIKNKKKKASQFDCLTCNKLVSTEVIDGKIIGENCRGDCKFNISKFMIKAIEISKVKDSE